MIEVNGQKYPMKTVPQCRTCMSPYRLEIEQAVLEQRSYQKIADAVADRKPGVHPNPGYQSIRDHVNKGHMPIGPTAERALVEARAKDIGRDIETYAAGLADYRSVNQIIIQRGMDRLARGELKPSMAELLTAIRQEHAMETATDSTVTEEAYQQAIIAYMEVAQAFIPPDRFQEYGQALARHPVIRALMSGQAPKALETVSEDE
jgi:hypothetical protein